MDRVIFLDRDGTINEEVEYLHRPEDLRLLPGVGEAIRRLREHGFAVVVVTKGTFLCRQPEDSGDQRRGSERSVFGGRRQQGAGNA